MPLLPSEADVRALVNMDELIEIMGRALASFSTGGTVQPVRTVVEIAARRAFFGTMPAYLADPPALGAKLVSVYPGNPARGLPSHQATIVLQDPETGSLLAVLDGRYVTEARTAAVSAVSARMLATSGPAVLAILGSGVQAGSHLEAIGRVTPGAGSSRLEPEAGAPRVVRARDGRNGPRPDPRRRERRARGARGEPHHSASVFDAAAAVLDACEADDKVIATMEAAGSWAREELAPVAGARAVNCNAAGSYDGSAPPQSGARDSEIAASGAACP